MYEVRETERKLLPWPRKIGLRGTAFVLIHKSSSFLNYCLFIDVITVIYASTSKEINAVDTNNIRLASPVDGKSMMYDEILLHQKGGYLNYEKDIASEGYLNAALSGAIRCLF